MGSQPADQNKLEAARARYREERDKRLGRGGGRGITEIVGDLKRYLDDPFLKPVPRVPLHDEVDVLCIGAGFAGLLMAARMREAGVEKVRLVDSAGDVGGVWYWNRYPEAKCDVDSLIYMPLLEETGYVPKWRYAPAPEIGEHARRIARHFGLYEHALFHTSVEEIVWDEALGRWHVHTDRGDDILAQFVVTCNGPMSKVKLPEIPGIESFKGHSFHTSRWDYDYTGGGPEDPKLDKLRDKVVGLIGTGATGLQCVGPLGQSAKHFYLFQRTPSSVGVRNNRRYDPSEIADFAPGWQKRRQENFTKINFGDPVEEDMVQDGWTDIYASLNSSPRFAGLSGAERALEKERIDLEKMESIRNRIDSIVTDPETAEKLKPWYSYMCKRPGFHDEYLPTFNLPNVTLVDTQGAGVEAVDETGVIVNGEKIELDCLIYGTGFETETGGKLRMGFDVIGKHGVSLADKWREGMTTMHGITVSGFPNLFIIPGLNAQAVVTTNVVHMTSEYAQHIAYIVRTLREKGATKFELTAAAEAEWVDTIVKRRVDMTAFLDACTPGRYNYEGNTGARPIQNAVFGGGAMEYFGILAAWRDTGALPGLALSGD